VGRHKKLTPEREAKIIQATRAGCDVEVASRAAGVSRSTYYRWKARGEREHAGEYHDFVQALRAAEAEAEVHAVVVIRKAMHEGDWRASLAFLERRFPERWSKRTTTQLTGADGGPVQTDNKHHVDLSALTTEQLETLETINAQLDANTRPSIRRR
jgi:hypothetical protein